MSALYFAVWVDFLVAETEEQPPWFLLSPTIRRVSSQGNRSSKAWTLKEWIKSKGTRATHRKTPGNIPKIFFIFSLSE
jgi:hypothetical protein